MMILGDEADVHVHPHVVRLALSEKTSETTTTLIVMKDEVALNAGTSESVHSPHDQAAHFHLPKVDHIRYQTIDHQLSVG